MGCMVAATHHFNDLNNRRRRGGHSDQDTQRGCLGLVAGGRRWRPLTSCRAHPQLRTRQRHCVQRRPGRHRFLLSMAGKYRIEQIQPLAHRGGEHQHSTAMLLHGRTGLPWAAPSYSRSGFKSIGCGFDEWLRSRPFEQASPEAGYA